MTDTFYTAESLTPGNTYKFKVQSRNSVGYSPFSNEVSILAAQVPSTPEAPLTILSGTSVIISWLVPYNGGSTITSYTITIRESDGVTFSEDATSCDGSDPTIMAQKRCVVSFDVFRGEQFNLPWGSSIYAKVYAKNIMGDSITSAAGNGAIITTTPSAPIDLIFDYAISNAEQISISWSAPVETGGVEILDYRIWYDQGIDDFTILDYGIQEF